MYDYTGPYYNRYYHQQEPSNMDSLKLHIACRNPILNLVGFYIRYLLVLRKNYLGKNTTFVSTEQYNNNLKASPPSAKVTSKLKVTFAYLLDDFDP
jgi:hypothetical protein